MTPAGGLDMSAQQQYNIGGFVPFILAVLYAAALIWATLTPVIVPGVECRSNSSNNCAEWRESLQGKLWNELALEWKEGAK